MLRTHVLGRKIEHVAFYSWRCFHDVTGILGLPVYAVQNVGKQDPQQTTVVTGSEAEKAEETAPATPKTTFGKLIYKGQGCNFSVACITAEGKAEKLGAMQVQPGLLLLVAWC